MTVTVVLAGNRRQYDDWCRMNQRNPHDRDLICITTYSDWHRLRGVTVSNVVHVGTWDDMRHLGELLAIIHTRMAQVCPTCDGTRCDPDDPGDYDNAVHMYNPYTRGPCPTCNGTGVAT